MNLGNSGFLLRLIGAFFVCLMVIVLEFFLDPKLQGSNFSLTFAIIGLVVGLFLVNILMGGITAYIFRKIIYEKWKMYFVSAGVVFMAWFTFLLAYLPMSWKVYDMSTNQSYTKFYGMSTIFRIVRQVPETIPQMGITPFISALFAAVGAVLFWTLIRPRMKLS